MITLSGALIAAAIIAVIWGLSYIGSARNDCGDGMRFIESCRPMQRKKPSRMDSIVLVAVVIVAWLIFSVIISNP